MHNLVKLPCSIRPCEREKGDRFQPSRVARQDKEQIGGAEKTTRENLTDDGYSSNSLCPEGQKVRLKDLVVG